ncbi:MAG: FAD-binding oxidoreductase [Gemmatimonadota bacterium]|nr:FAD-binding oxidoreductase [Gemmatimonadota bacterium]
MSTDTVDVVVVGAGIVGASCAWHLASRGLRVVALETEAAPAMGSTGKSAAGVRVQFTTAPNIRLSMHSLPFYRSFETRFGMDIGYRPIGYLLLAPEERWDQHLESVELQRSLGAPVDVFSPEEALRFLPFDTEGLAGATRGPWDGVIDPHMATQAFVTMAKREGAEFRFGDPVTAVTRSPSGGWEIVSAKGRVHADYVVNAAGAWSGEVASLAGLDVPVGPKKIQIFLSAPIDDERTYPLTVDLATGVYVRSEGDRVLFGKDRLDQEIGFEEGMDWSWMEHVLLTGVTRFPWWEDLGVDRKSSWWGYYEMSPDHSPIIEAHPHAPTWIDACGFSGHGIMHAPATGLAVSEIVADGASRTLDVSAFGHARFGANLPHEVNVF